MCSNQLQPLEGPLFPSPQKKAVSILTTKCVSHQLDLTGILCDGGGSKNILAHSDQLWKVWIWLASIGHTPPPFSLWGHCPYHQSLGCLVFPASKMVTTNFFLFFCVQMLLLISICLDLEVLVTSKDSDVWFSFLLKFCSYLHKSIERVVYAMRTSVFFILNWCIQRKGWGHLPMDTSPLWSRSICTELRSPLGGMNINHQCSSFKADQKAMRTGPLDVPWWNTVKACGFATRISLSFFTVLSW